MAGPLSSPGAHQEEQIIAPLLSLASIKSLPSSCLCPSCFISGTQQGFKTSNLGSSAVKTTLILWGRACCTFAICWLVPGKQLHSSTWFRVYGVEEQRAGTQICCPQQVSLLPCLGTVQHIGTTCSCYTGDPQSTLSTSGSLSSFPAGVLLRAQPQLWQTSKTSDFTLHCLYNTLQ